MSYERLPIVGAHYRPPAKLLISVLPIGTPLFLLAEPDNAYDPNAIMVMLETQNIPDEADEVLEQQLPEFGLDLDMITSQDQWHLGYIPKEFAAMLRAADIVKVNVPSDVTFGTNPKGDPRVVFAEPVL